MMPQSIRKGFNTGNPIKSGIELLQNFKNVCYVFHLIYVSHEEMAMLNIVSCSVITYKKYLNRNDTHYDVIIEILFPSFF